MLIIINNFQRNRIIVANGTRYYCNITMMWPIWTRCVSFSHYRALLLRSLSFQFSNWYDDVQWHVVIIIDLTMTLSIRLSSTLNSLVPFPISSCLRSIQFECLMQCKTVSKGIQLIFDMYSCHLFYFVCGLSLFLCCLSLIFWVCVCVWTRFPLFTVISLALYFPTNPSPLYLLPKSSVTYPKSLYSYTYVVFVQWKRALLSLSASNKLASHSLWKSRLFKPNCIVDWKRAIGHIHGIDVTFQYIIAWILLCTICHIHHTYAVFITRC